MIILQDQLDDVERKYDKERKENQTLRSERLAYKNTILYLTNLLDGIETKKNKKK